jgi:hypothetical protein
MSKLDRPGDEIYKIPQRRWSCSDCGAEGWETPGYGNNRRFDHDRPQGGHCRKSEAKKRAEESK